jgi:hypothetical protein
MSFAETVLLGALAGFTIYLGLPVGRLELLSARARVALAMFSVGILVFLLVDVLAHGFEISEEAVTAFHDGKGSFGHAAALALLLVGGFALGSAGLGILERRLRPRAPTHPPIAGGATDALTAEDPGVRERLGQLLDTPRPQVRYPCVPRCTALATAMVVCTLILGAVVPAATVAGVAADPHRGQHGHCEL